MIIVAQEMEIKPGYKLTEVGVIPKDWKLEKLGNCILGTPQYGINASAMPYKDTLPIYIRITDITEESHFSTENIVSVKHASADKYILTPGDLVFARTGASVGKTYLYKLEDGELVFAGYLIRVKVNPSKMLPNYLAVYVKTKHYWNWVRVMSMRSGQPGINGNEYTQLPIPLPPLSEQHAIATALSDVDALIASLDKLIAKKHDIKQATMQQLLTGKTRLPGFGGEWKIIILEDVADKNVQWSIAGGPFGSNLKAVDYVPEGVRIIQLQNIGDGVFHDGYKIYTSEEKADELISCNIYPGEIILSKMGDPVARACIVPSSDHRYLMASDGIRLAVDKRHFNTHFIHDYINSPYFRKKAMEASTGSTRQRIALGDLKKLPIVAPPFPEQTAIATVLSDMDAEIAALEHKREKTYMLKQGMMQELLTGKTRLV